MPNTRSVILRINIAEPNYDPVEETEVRSLVDDPAPVCLAFTHVIQDQGNISARTWRTIARGLDQLVADAKAVEGPTRFVVVGRAPLPAFAYLGSRMSRMGPTVVANKFREWEFYEAPELCPKDGRDDASIEPPGLGHDKSGRLALSLQSSKEYLDDDDSIAGIVNTERVRFLGTYKIQNKQTSHRVVPLTPAELPVYLKHVEGALDWRKAQLPAADGGLVVALACPAGLAYWVGHRLNPNVLRGRVDYPNHGSTGYVRALSDPMHKAPWLAGKAKLLVMNAEPVDQVATRAAKNFDTIQDALERELGRDGPFEFRVRGAARLREFMRDVELFKPDILHLHLHGSKDGDLAFENADGQTDRLSPEGFVDRLRATGVQPALIVLSACYSEKLAPALLGIAECVVAMRGKARTNHVIEFAHYFYEALGRGNNLARAIEQGKSGADATEVEFHTVGDVRPEDIILIPG